MGTKTGDRSTARLMRRLAKEVAEGESSVEIKRAFEGPSGAMEVVTTLVVKRPFNEPARA
jgi:hypothetical protein